MARRKRIKNSRRHRKYLSHTAKRTRALNLYKGIHRGGYRM